jgi:hypothetical protein
MNQNVKRSIEFQFGVDLGPAENSIESLESQLESLKSKFKVAEIGSAEFDKLGKEIDSTTRELKKLEDQFNQTEQDLKSQEANIKLLGGAINILGGAVETTVGTLGLLGLDEEVVGEFEKAALGAIAFADGTKRIFEGYKELQEGVQLANDLIKKQGLATKILTGIQAAYNAVMNANPIFIIITVLAAVTVGIYALSKALADDTEEVEKNNQARLKQAQTLSSEAKFREDYAKALGKSTQELREFEKATTQANLTEARAELKAAKTTEDKTKALTKIRDLKRKDLIDEANYQKQVRTENAATQKEIQDKNKETLDKQKENRQKNLEEQAAAFQKELELANQKALDQEAIDNKAYDLLLTDQERELNAVQDKYFEIFNKANLSAEQIKALEEKKEKEINDIKKKYSKEDENLTKEALNALKSAQDLEIQAVQDKYAKLKTAKELSDADLIALEEKSQSEIKAITDKYGKMASDKREADRKKKLEEILRDTSAVAGASAQLFGALAEAQDVATKEGFEANKKYKIAEVITSAIQGSIQAISSAFQLGPVAGPIVAAAQVASLAIAADKAISDIKSTKFGDSTPPTPPNGGTTNIPSGGAITPPVPSGFLAPTTPTSTSTQSQTPVRAYVLASDVSNGVQAQNSINRRRRLGTN